MDMDSHFGILGGLIEGNTFKWHKKTKKNLWCRLLESFLMYFPFR